MRSTPPLPLSVKRALAKLGQDIRSARLRRRITTTTMAERAFITRMTLRKVERGDPGVGLGIYATVMFVLGPTPRVADLADSRADEVGLQLEEERLPQRIRSSGVARRKPRFSVRTCRRLALVARLRHEPRTARYQTAHSDDRDRRRGRHGVTRSRAGSRVAFRREAR